jgi:phosphoribosylformylglycinamidine synthase
MNLKWAVVRFPGSNSDFDALRAIQNLSGVQADFHWHEDPIEPHQYDALFLPGGFSYGDYLRAGAIASHAPCLRNLNEVVSAGCHVMGICNGFQILLEARLLPGFLQVNESLRFIAKRVSCQIQKSLYPWFTEEDVGKNLLLPIAHRFGNYQVSKMDRMELEPALCYQEPVNGSVENLAGVYRRVGEGSVFGLMPHPERACHSAIGLSEGRLLFENASRLLLAGRKNA